MIITRTPYRLSLFGGGTDFFEWYNENPTTVIVAAMDYYGYVLVTRKPKFFPEYISKIAYSDIEYVKQNADIKHPSVRECLRYFDFETGLDLAHFGDLPARSGIGSSSSFTVGLLKAIHGLKNSNVSKTQLFQEAIYIEQEMIGEAVGVQDQISAAYGGINVIKLGPGKKIRVSALTPSFSYTEYLRRSILMGFTGLSRDGTAIIAEHKNKIYSKEINNKLSEVSQISKEANKMLLKEMEIEEIGKLLNHAWKLKKGFSDKISPQMFDEIYKTAVKNGAVGGKLMGAGGSGFFYFLAPPQKHEKIKRALPEVRVWVPFRFANKGSSFITRIS